MQVQHSGWRKASPVADSTTTPHHSEKSDLFETARMAARALDLPASCRFLLDQLCAAYGGEPIRDRILVWPSNDWLQSRTGIAERTIRHAIGRLVGLGLITMRDSPNGKRFARRDRQGRVTDAYGFDLTPLLSRMSEFKEVVAQRQAQERERKEALDTITIHRRSAQEALRALLRDHPSIDTSELERRTQALAERLPRRSVKVIPHETLRAWAELRADIEAVLLSATGGNICRHKDTNTNIPENPCNRRRTCAGADLVRETCPDAVQIIGRPENDDEVFALASRCRGILGVSRDGWMEARGVLGDLGAAKMIYHLVQMQTRPSPGAQQIRNFGGYLRAMTRMAAERKIEIDTEMRRRHQSARTTSTGAVSM
jgi:replication initiation protein RepC